MQDSPTLDAQGAQTVEMQVLLDALPDQGRMGLFENKGECSLFVDANGLDCRANSVKVTGVPIDAGVWTHVACTINDDTMQVFVNGALWGEDQGPLPDVDIAMPIAIANTAPGWNEPLLGALDRVRVWSEALSPAELCALSGAPDC